MSAEALHIAWAKLFLRAAWHAGVRDVVLSPGSRSTPLAIAAHESPDLRTEIVLDERSAAFFALGQARVTGRPTVLACTSGTAAAHYFPAIIEASMSGVPLLALTADRPWELQQAGASQTIDQHHLFGGFTRGFFALGAPEPTEAALRAVARTAAQAVAAALGPTPGPVHVNAPFRKPLEPLPFAAGERDAPWISAYESLLRAGPARVLDARAARGDDGRASRAFPGPRSSGEAAAATRPSAARATADPAAVAEVARLLDGAERGLVVCGPAPAHGDVAGHRRAILALGAALGFPILAEATSQVRFGAEEAQVAGRRAPVLVAAIDALLRSRSFRARFAPDVIIEIGAPPTSTGYAQLLADSPPRRRVILTPHDHWTDPSSTASILVRTDVPSFCLALAEHLAAPASDPASAEPSAQPRASDPGDERRRAASRGADSLSPAETATFASAVAAADRSARAAILESLASTGARSPGVADLLTEAAVARGVVAACPPGSILVLGNSSPVRDVDAYVFPSSVPLRVLHQRGASGIDGLVSGAAGAQHVSGGSVTLLLGDLSFLHDIGGLALARRARGPLVIVAVDNGGGRIFEQLPIHRALTGRPDERRAPAGSEVFERLFATPEALDYAAAAATFGVAFARAGTAAELDAALAEAHSRPGATLVQAVVPPHDGAERHKAVWTRIEELFHPRKDTAS